MESNSNDRDFFSEKKLTTNDSFELLCCGGAHPTTGPANEGKTWLTAAELVYNLTGQSGTVVDETITFILEDSKKIEISLLGGYYKIFAEGGSEPINSGRKAVELLMFQNGLTFEAALKWITENYNVTLTENLANDYVKMKLEELR